MKNNKTKILLLTGAILLACFAEARANNIETAIQNNIPSDVYKKARDSWEQINQSREKEGLPLLPENEMIKWTYEEADLDGTNSRDYLIIAYGDYVPTYYTLIILKKTNENYAKIWELSHNVWFLDFDITLDDLDGDGKPEIIIRSLTGDGKNSNFDIIKWQGNASYKMPLELMDAEFVDLDRDGIKEILGYNYKVSRVNELPDGSVEKDYASWYDVYKYNGTQYVFKKTMTNEEGKSAFLMANVEVTPKKWSLAWATKTQPNRIRVAISNIEESNNVTGLDSNSVRMEDRIRPIQTIFEEGKFIAIFDESEVMQYLLKAPRPKPITSGDKIDVTVSALLFSGQYVSGSSRIEIIKELEPIPFSKFDIKHWLINWGKHEKNKFQIVGKIGLPGDYVIDSLKKTGIVKITIDKKDSSPYSQNSTIYFKQKGPIWSYKAHRGNGTQPLEIEKMLIFWQPEYQHNKPDKDYNKHTGWFMIQGNINISDADQAALLPKASITLNIPVEDITTAGSLESTASADFTIKKDIWLYKSTPPDPDYKDNWWEDVKDDD